MFKNYDTIICPNGIKEKILNDLTKNKEILNLKFFTLDEFKKAYFGTYNNLAIYYLMKKNSYSYDTAKTYLDNYYFLPQLKQELEENNLIIKENILIKRIVIVGYTLIDKYLMDEIKKYDYLFIDSALKSSVKKAYECQNKLAEVNFVIDKIYDLLKTVDINNIFLVNVGSEYVEILKRQCNFYKLPINLNNQKSIYGTKIVKEFLKNLKEKKEIILGDDEISELIVKIVNKYITLDIDDTFIKCIDYELRHTYIPIQKLDNAVNIKDIEDINEEGYYFVLGFNEGSIPKLYTDIDFLSDMKKESLGILTSNEKNKDLKKRIINNLSYENVTITYNVDDKFPSSLINEYNIAIEKVNKTNYNSDIYNKLLLSEKLDNFIKYNEESNDLSLLFNNYKNIDYLNYNNQYTGIDKELFKKKVKELKLSYTNIDRYYKCPFSFYITDILKLDKYEDTFTAYIGTVFHYILSICKKDNFNFENEFSKFIQKRELSIKEKFFLDQLKENLLYAIEVVKQFDTYSTFDDELYEKKIEINKSREIKITFKGVVDKIKYRKINNKTYVAIIDYKTGNTNIDINHVKDGLGMQLPIYLYLVKHSDLQDVEFAGFYLQHILPNKDKEVDNYEEALEKKYYLEGYSNANEDILKLFDKNYMESKMIKSMHLNNDGSYYRYAKVLNNDEINALIDMTENKINEAIDNILDTNFKVEPKYVDGKLVGCEYCKYQDLCFRKGEDIKRLD